MKHSGEWYQTRWWRVIAPDGSLWCETSNGQEALDSKRDGDTLQALYIRQDTEWRDGESSIEEVNPSHICKLCKVAPTDGAAYCTECWTGAYGPAGD
jgi:hypothetical protein